MICDFQQKIKIYIKYKKKSQLEETKYQHKTQLAAVLELSDQVPGQDSVNSSVGVNMLRDPKENMGKQCVRIAG